MKKILLFLLSLLSSSTAGWSQEFTFQILSSENMTATVTGGTSLSGVVEIPDTYTDDEGQDYTVVSIAEEAFKNCDEVTQFVIPSTVDTIRHLAFMGCTMLNKAVIPATVVSIGYNPFANCTQLPQIEVEEGNTHYVAIDSALFTKTNKNLISFPAFKYVEDYVFPVDSRKVGPYAFMGCHYIESITFSDSTRSVGPYALTGCTSLRHLYIGDSLYLLQSPQFLTKLNDLAADNEYYSIEALHFKSKTTAPFITGCCSTTNTPDLRLYVPLGKGNVYRNSTQWISGDSPSPTGFADLMSLVREEGYADIDENETPIFYRSIWENDTVKMGAVAVAQTSVQKGYSGDLVIPATIQVGDSTFTVVQFAEILYNSDEVTSISLPSTIQSLAETSLAYLKGLTSVTVADDNAYFVSDDGVLYDKNKTKLIVLPSANTRTSFTTPSTVDTIGYAAISENPYLVDFSSNATVVLQENFLSCTSLQKVTLTNPGLDSVAFRNPGTAACFLLSASKVPAWGGGDYVDSPYDCALVVADTMVQKYKDEGWEDYFGSIVSPVDNASFDDSAFGNREAASYVGTLNVTLNFSKTTPRSSYLPFSAPVSTLESCGLEAYAFNDAYVDDGNNLCFVFQKVQKGYTPVNKPLVLIPDSAKSKSFTVSDVLFAKDPTNGNLDNWGPSDYSWGANVYGTTSSTTTVSGENYSIYGNYAIGNGVLGKVGESTTVRPYRWSVTVWGGYGASSMRLCLQDDEEVELLDALESVNQEEPESLPIYNLCGQRVLHLSTPGIYVQRNRTFIVR